MARTKGPLMSVNATGNWGKGTIQFRAGKNGTHAYRPADPTTVNQAQATAAQETVRERYRLARTAWQAIDIEERQAHDAAAATQGMSGWNLFMQKITTGQRIETTMIQADDYQPIQTNTGQVLTTTGFSA